MAPLRSILHLCVILDRPQVEIKRTSPVSEAKEGDEMILECLVKRSHPMPFTYQWYKGNTKLDNSGPQYRKTIVPTDEGHYRCAAENTAGLSVLSQPIWINVQCKCQSFSYCMFVTAHLIQ